MYKQFPNARMIFVGDKTSSGYHSQLTWLIRRYEMEENIKFAGKRDDIPEILKASDIFVLPSRSEGLCLALIEATVAGLPCVATKVGGIPEVINHRKNGLLFERDNVEELAGHLIRLIKDQPLRTKIALQASCRAREFGMPVYVDKIFQCYKVLIDNSTARS